MADVRVVPDARGYLAAALEGFIRQGWTVLRLPAQGRLSQNRQLVELDYEGNRELYRLMVYKVGQSGRQKSHERRIEITSTYFGGRLPPEPAATDVVLGYALDEEVFVGFDSRRLEHGGRTENASAFIDVEGLRLASDVEITVLPRESELFGFEYHAFFRAPRIAEYLTNRSLIHAGAYTGAGTFSGTYPQRRHGVVRVREEHAVDRVVVLAEPTSTPRPRTVRGTDVEAIESGRTGRLRSRRLTPEQFQNLLRQAEQNGALGERIALEEERQRLRRGGRGDLADLVRWTSQENVLAGYDISSFDLDGSSRFIEVKATSTAVRRFIISPNEWRTAEALGDRYWIYFVIDVRRDPQVTRLQNPVALEAAGKLHREPEAWIVTLNE